MKYSFILKAIKEMKNDIDIMAKRRKDLQAGRIDVEHDIHKYKGFHICYVSLCYEKMQFRILEAHFDIATFLAIFCSICYATQLLRSIVTLTLYISID